MEKQKKLGVVVNIFISIISVGILAALSSIFVNPQSSWYVELNKPSEFLPSIVFLILWTIIYVAMLVTVFLLLQKNQMDKKAIILLCVNAFLQVLWGLVFFGLHSLLGGLCVIVALIFASVWLLLYLSQKQKLYGYLLLIYPMWIVLATLSNAAIWTLN